MQQSKLFHVFFFAQIRFLCVYKWEWEWNIMTDWLTTQQLKYRRHCPHLNGRYQAEFWLLFFLLCLVTHTFFSLYFFAWVVLCDFFLVGYIEGTESRQYTRTTETVVLISSLSHSISGLDWVRGCVLCEFEGFWDSLVMKPVAFYLFFRGVSTIQVCLCACDSICAKLVSNSFGCIIVIMLLFRHFLLIFTFISSCFSFRPIDRDCCCFVRVWLVKVLPPANTVYKYFVCSYITILTNNVPTVYTTYCFSSE